MSFRLMTLLFKTNAALLRVSLNQKILPQVGQQSKHTTISSNVTHLLIWIGPDKKKATQTLTSVKGNPFVCTAMPKKKTVDRRRSIVENRSVFDKEGKKICEGEDKHRWKLLF